MDSLANAGLHFSLCRPDNPKAAVRSDYLERKPNGTEVINHVRDGQPIGIIPISCNSAVVDVDHGNHRRIANEHRPYLTYPSTSGYPKAHLWYRVGKPRNQNQFSFLDCSGQIISSNHVAFPNPEVNLPRLYEAFLNPSNNLFVLPPIPYPSPQHTQDIGVLGIGASLSPSLPPLIAEYAPDGNDGLKGVGEGSRHNALLRALVAWVKGQQTKPAPSEIRDQAQFLRDTLDDVHDFEAPEVLAIADWAIRKVQAGDIRRELTQEQRRNGGRVKALRVRQRNVLRDTQILSFHRDGLSNRKIAARIGGISEAMVRKVLKREV